MRKLILLTLIFILNLLVVNSQLLTVDDAVAAYRFDEGSGLNCNDSTPNNLFGTITGANFILSKGTNNTGTNALRFDGVDDFCRVPDSFKLNLTQNLSIVVWINKTAVGDSDIVLYKNVEGTDSNYGIEIRSTNIVTIWQRVTGETTRSQETTIAIPTDQWVHLVVMINGTNDMDAEIYFDGVKQETVAGSSFGFDSIDEDLYIGVTASENSDLDGDLDEVYIFNRTLSQAEIIDLRDNGIGIAASIAFNTTNLDVFLSKNPVEILEEFTLFANYTNATDNQPIENAFCFANSSLVGGGSSGFGRGVLGIGGLSTINNAVHTQVNDIFGLNTLRVDIDNLPLGKASYGVNFRFHAHNQTPTDNLRVFGTCHNNLSFNNFTFLDQVNSTEAVISTSTGNDTIWGFENVVLFGQSVASPNCSIVFESVNTSIDKHWMIADTSSSLNLNNSFTSDDFGVTYTLRTNADERSPFVDAGFGLDVPNETTLTFNSTSGLYFLPNIRHGRPFDFNDTVFCSEDNFQNDTDFVITNVEDNLPPIVQIVSIDPTLVIFNITTVTIQWNVNDPELLTNFINVSFPNGSLIIQTDVKPLILTPSQLTALGNYTVVAFANDTGGLFNISNITFEVRDIDTTPPIITLVSPSNNTRNNTVPLPITFQVTDNFPNDIICTLSNSTNAFDSGTFLQGVDSVLTLALGEIALDQNFPDLEITCFDNTLLNNSAIFNLNYTLDTVPPIIFTISPSDNQRFNKDVSTLISIKANCTDAPVFRFNITIENSTGRIASFESRSPVNNFIVIDENLDISNLGVGNYTVNHTCSDPHTKRIIGDYNIRKNTSDTAIRYFTTSNNNFKIRYLQNSLSVDSFGSEKTETQDKYRFWFNTNETESKTKRTFIFELVGDKPVYYLSDSKYRGHFVTGDNWIDFQLDDKDALYLVTKNSRGNWEVEITTTKTNLNFNSVGDLNIATITTQFEIFSVPQVEDFFDVRICRSDTGSVLLLGLFILIALFFIGMGLMSGVGFIGLFGALMLMILSWFIAPCIGIFALVMGLFSLVLMVFFAVASLGF